MTSNIIKSMNSRILKVYKMPFISILEIIWEQFMVQYNERHVITNTIIGPLSSSVEQEIKQKQTFVHTYYIIPSSNTIFICLLEQSSNISDFQNCLCICNQQKLFGILCIYLITTLFFMQKSISNYFAYFYIVQAQFVIYIVSNTRISSIVY